MDLKSGSDLITPMLKRESIALLKKICRVIVANQAASIKKSTQAYSNKKAELIRNNIGMTKNALILNKGDKERYLIKLICISTAAGFLD